MKNQDPVVDLLPQDEPVETDEVVPVNTHYESFDSFF
jgi:hypothetical protein